MVTGFEDITNELTPFETKVILPMVVASWSKKDPAHKEIVLMKDMITKTNDYCHKYNICSSRELKSGVVRVSKKPYKTTGPRMRKVIHHIRTRGLIKDLVATSNGYFRTDDPKEIANFIKSCRERANSFNEVADAMNNFHNIKVSDCCKSEMIPPMSEEEMEEANMPPSMWRAAVCYVCKKCEKPCHPKKL